LFVFVSDLIFGLACVSVLPRGDGYASRLQTKLSVDRN
jgi:hypothetical protein